MDYQIQKCPNCGGNKAILTGINQYQCQYCGTTFAGKNESAEQQPANTVCRCPICGGEIAVGAQKCRHCGEWLTPSWTPAPPCTPATKRQSGVWSWLPYEVAPSKRRRANNVFKSVIVLGVLFCCLLSECS